MENIFLEAKQRELKEQKVIEGRRQIHEERRQRVLNARYRTMGIDTQAIQEQIDEKKRINDLEKAREEALDRELVRADLHMQVIEKQRERDVRAMNVNTQEFRDTFQQPHMRREFDLSDPNGLKKEIPARIEYDDPRCGVSSMQKFDGEDAHYAERLRQQRAQQREWCEQQSLESSERKRLELEADHIYAARMMEVNQRQKDMEKENNNMRRDCEKETKNFNLAQARDGQEREREKRAQEVNDNLEEIRNHLESDFLNENPDTYKSCISNHRVVPYAFKGFTPDQNAKIRAEQDIQRAERAQLKDREKQEEKLWNAHAEQHWRSASVVERNIERTKAQMRRDNASELLAQAAEQKRRKDKLYNEIYKNDINEDYYGQFGSSCR